MIKLTLLFIFTIGLAGHTCLQAQTKITGEIIDGGDKTTKLARATIMLLQAKDSILVDYTRADENGKFILTKPDTLPYLLVASYPKFGEFKTEINGKEDVRLGQIPLTSVSHLIEEVMVTGKIPVVVKGDTTEYDASSFTVEKNAKVEDLLKVLPGISVDGNGKITAQGKTVEKVLVDGEEFFGDDPTLVTKNIRSDMVDKVQVYEKKSEETDRTGVDDGERTQTINVKLKEDAKKGMFGKLEGAGGTDGFYLGKAAVNKFNGNQKIGAYAMGANDGNIGLDWRDSEKYGMSQMETGFTDNGDMYMVMSADGMDRWDGKGRPKAFNTGVSFSDAWKEGKHKVNGSYKYGTVQNDISEENVSKSSQGADAELNSTSTSRRKVDARKQRFNAKYDGKLDSLTTLTLSISASKDKTENDYTATAYSRDGRDSLLNDNTRTGNGESNNDNFSYKGYLTRKFKKMGRSLSMTVGGDISDFDGTSSFYSKTNYYTSKTQQTDDQYKVGDSKTNSVRAALTYTEPILSTLNTSIGYEYSRGANHAINNSYNKDNEGRYTVLDSLYSSDFDYNTVRNAVNVALTYKLDKFTTTFSNNLRHDDLFQRNNSVDKDLNRSFFTYNPVLSLRYNLTKQKRINFWYSHSNNLPSLYQIQPLRENSDRLNIVVGNESLKPSNTDSYSVYFSNYNSLRGTNIYVNMGIGRTYNSIQQNVTVNTDGTRILFYENLNDRVATNAHIWGGSGFDVSKKRGLRGDIGVNGDYNKYYNYINEGLNENTSFNYSMDFRFSKNTTKNIDFNLNVEPGWRTLKTSLNSEMNSSGFTLNSSLWYQYKLPWKLNFYGDLSYRYEAPTKALNEKFAILLFRPGISKKFLKDESLALDIYVNDLFKQNKGFSRYQYGSSITQNNYNTISRYLMLKVSWDFTTMKGAKD